MTRTVIGAVGLLIAAAASLMLVLQHMVGMTLPGCGVGSPCAEAAATAWGKVPGLGWPTSFVGLTYFLAMLAAWLHTRGVPGALVRSLAMLGGVASVILTVAMIVGRYVCPYCLIAHAGNVMFIGAAIAAWLASRRSTGQASSAPPRRAPAAGVVAFCIGAIVVAGGLFAAEHIVDEKVQEHGERELADTAKRLQQAEEEVTPFTGRYLEGPENAPIRIVLFSDFQCQDCQRIDRDIRQLMRERNDLSVSAKHFPMSSVCNEHIGVNMHPNACYAAFAAEAAGILRGNEGFWQMHDWLFDHGGGFTRPELQAALAEMGYDAAQFEAVMTGPEVAARVKADIEEALALGIHYTPMIFINGVELKGMRVPGALRRMVDVVAASNPEPADPTADRPPTATEKYIADWQEQPQRTLPPAAMSWPWGPEDAEVEIVVWGDLQEPNCAECDRQIREYMQDRGGVRYEFRHFPFDQTCNPSISTTKFPFGCTAARAALAAGRLTGGEGYWDMHVWLMENQLSLDQALLTRAATEIGIDPTLLMNTMNAPSIASAIQSDCQIAKNLGLSSIPFVFINGRWAPRWSHDTDKEMLAKMLDAARTAKEAQPAGH